MINKGVVKHNNLISSTQTYEGGDISGGQTSKLVDTNSLKTTIFITQLNSGIVSNPTQQKKVIDQQANFENKHIYQIQESVNGNNRNIKSQKNQFHMADDVNFELDYLPDNYLKKFNEDNNELQFQFMDADQQRQLQGIGREPPSSSEVSSGFIANPQRPTHRRKKSQQPTLMTTKQKQQSNNNGNPAGLDSNAPSSASNTNRHQQQQQQQNLNMNQPPLLSDQTTGELSQFRHQYQQSMVGPTSLFEFQEERNIIGDLLKKSDLKSNAVLKNNSNLNRPSGSANVKNPVSTASHLIVTSAHHGISGTVQNQVDLDYLQSSSQGRSKNSNLKDKISAVESRSAAQGGISSASSYQQLRTTDQIEHQKQLGPDSIKLSRQMQTLSPKLQQHFPALNQVRESARNVIGFESANSLQSLENKKQSHLLSGSSQGSDHSNLRKLSLNMDKCQDAIKQQLSKNTLKSSSLSKNTASQNPPTRQISHHKRNQTKTQIPIAQLLSGAHKSAKNYAGAGFGSGSHHQKHATIDQDYQHITPFTQSHPLLPIESSSLNTNNSSSLLPTHYIYQQLVQSIEDPKTAYLRHAKDVPFQPHHLQMMDHSDSKRIGNSLVIMQSGATSVQNSQHLLGETPQRPIVTGLVRGLNGGGGGDLGLEGSSNAKQNSMSSQSGVPKRVTFDAPVVDSSDSQRQMQSGINEEEDEDQSDSFNPNEGDEELDEQMISYVLHEDISHARLKNQRRISGSGEDEDTEGIDCEDAPTVVIDDSIDDQHAMPILTGQYQRQNEDEAQNEYGNNSSGGIRVQDSKSAISQSHQFLDNIQAALQSIRDQEAQEHENSNQDAQLRSKKKGVTIMSIEEEEDLINQINEIRDRIRRGETAAQQQKKQSQPVIEEDSREEQMESFNEYGAHGSGLQQHGIIQKPPLYSLTFVIPDHVDDPGTSEYTALQMNSQEQKEHQRSFHSIDNNIGQVNCMIVTDGPNIYEKKRQRFERIQRMRSGGGGPSVDSAEGNYINSKEAGYNNGGGALQANQEYGTVVNLQKINDTKLPQSQIRQQLEGQNLTPMNSNAHNLIFTNMGGSAKSKDQQHLSHNKRLSEGKNKKTTQVTSKVKSYSQKQIKNAPAINHGIIHQIQVKKPQAANKSRQNSTADQLVQSLTSHSQHMYPHGSNQNAYQSHYKNSEIQVVNLSNPLGANNSNSTKSQSLSTNKDKVVGVHHHHRHPTVFTHQLNTLENNNQIIDGINYQAAANTYRPQRSSGIGVSSASYEEEDEEDLQIQLFSLRKVMAGEQSQKTADKGKQSQRPQTTSAVTKKKTISKSRKGAGSIHIPGTSQGFGNHALTQAKASLIVPSIQYPATVIHQKGKSISNNNAKNNRSNLLINVHEPPTAQHHQNPHHTIGSSGGVSQNLTHSLSLKRLKTPKIKDKDDMNTPPMERNGILNSQHSSKVSQQFQSVLPQSQLGNHALYQKQPGGQIFTKNQPVLNYQTNATVVHNNAYKSPFAYPQTSKASGSIGKQSNSGCEMKVIDNRSGRRGGPAASSSHVKQKSVQINSHNQLGNSAHHSRGHTRGNMIDQYNNNNNDSSCRSGSTHKVSIEPRIVNKLMKTKREVDSAFEKMKRKINEKPLLHPLTQQLMQSPQMIQPNKNISTVTTLTTNSNQALPSVSSFQASQQDLLNFQTSKLLHQQQQLQPYHHKPTQSIVVIPTKNTPIFGAAVTQQNHYEQMLQSSRTTVAAGGNNSLERQQQYESIQSAQKSINEFEREYKKLSGMMERIFTA